MDISKMARKWQGLVDQEGYLKDMVQALMQEALEFEFNKFIGADKNERSENRKGYRNGYYSRNLNLRVGTITLHVCRDRAGEFHTELFQKYQRSEKALVLSLMEMYVAGISTRKVSKVVEELCGFEISKSQVSDLVKHLDIPLEAWRKRVLTQAYKYLIFDARYEKVRENGQIISKAFVVAIGITTEGNREVIGTGVVDSESYEAWNTFIQELKDRGLSSVQFAVTDKNKGLCNALQKHFPNSKLQRCQVHFMRNFLAKISASMQAEAMALLQDVFNAQTKEEALQRVQKVSTFLIIKKKQDVADWLEENIEESLTVLDLPIEHRKKMKSTNMLERLNQELKRRSRVVRIFPNTASCLRLLTAVAQEISESWTGITYLKMQGDTIK